MASFSSHKLETPSPAHSRRNGTETGILKDLAGLDINVTTPMEALNLIQRWKELAREVRPEQKPNRNIQEHKNPSLFD
jgi:hypothetical protein